MPESVQFFFFKSKTLSSELAREAPTESRAFQYLLANYLLWTCSSYYDVLIGARLDWKYGLEWIIMLLITFVGLFRAYEANGGDRGSDFLTRVICLSFPIGFKLTLLSIGLSWALYFTLPLIPIRAQPSTVQGLLDLLLFVWMPVFAVLFFWRLSVHVNRIRQSQANLV